ncbi:transcriptional regulator family: Fungal Specific TF [Penicillium brevicompactum]|uniref:transcriptional regulator family: Fungal Specific TF n=1 Tax=Penicillium brevicompactum TaxID=5074 RepID=UPI00253F9631|nr:transcriptional regulator family: Fungal Specific TF [Penicillium brevicompactum]KAJ5327501.1 transcriptional regulator family: Fungal Specific TF [Penicillium brevicompactum]
MNLRKSVRSQPDPTQVDTRTSTPKSQSSGSQTPPRSRAGRKKGTGISHTKARRSRTGCFTCRQRHLKCDEAVGKCMNCRKSDRVCRRGVRLNFIDIQTVAPPHLIARPDGSKVTFRDDSRLIASLYVGGFEIYPPVQPESSIEENGQSCHDLDVIGPEDLTNIFQSVAHSFDPLGFDVPHPTADFVETDPWHQSHLVPGDELLPHGTSNFARKLADRQESHQSLTDPDSVSCLRAFVEEIGPRMDAMDEMNHFSQVLPALAVAEPLLLKALVASGAKYRSLNNPSWPVELATTFSQEATEALSGAIHDPSRDSVLCATIAMVLGFSASMSPHSMRWEDHLAGSRALIRECGWTAKTPGLGGACFRISISAEILSCVRHNWALSWNPDTWGVDIDMENAQSNMSGGHDLWHHRILYICAKVLMLRTCLRQNQNMGEEVTGENGLTDLFQEWVLYSRWCDQWEKSVPRALVPLGYLQPWQAKSKSVFPEVWLTTRSAIVARLIYHVTRIMLAKNNPLQSAFDDELHKHQQAHAYDVCGLVAHTKDRGIADIAIHCLVIAAECLEAPEAQHEALNIIDRMSKITGSSSDSIKDDLKQIWSWVDAHPHTVVPSQMHDNFYALDPALTIPETSNSPGNMNNPLLGTGDFSMENHPYQGLYVPPHHHHALNQYSYGPYLI